MKKTLRTYSLILIVLVVVMAGVVCQKLADINPISNFDVVANKTSFNIGDTVVFTIMNKADIILFYNGRPGMNINYRNRNYGKGTDILKFQTLVSQGSKNNMGDTIRLKISTNLKTYDSIGVANATWTDITNLAQWPTYATTTYVSSGKIDISQFNVSDTAYIAFQVIGNQNAKSAQRKWSIQNFTVSNTLSDSTFTPLFAPPFATSPNVISDTAPNFAYVGWSEVNMNYNRFFVNYPNNFFSLINTNYGAWNVGEYNVYTRSIYNRLIINNKACNSSGVGITTNYPLTFDPSSKTNTLGNEGWAITSPVNLNLVRHDFPTATVKDASNVFARGIKLVQANGTYATYSVVLDSTFVSGQTYDMAFVAQNANVNQKNEVVKHIGIKVN